MPRLFLWHGLSAGQVLGGRLVNVVTSACRSGHRQQCLSQPGYGFGSSLRHVTVTASMLTFSLAAGVFARAFMRIMSRVRLWCKDTHFLRAKNTIKRVPRPCTRLPLSSLEMA